MLDPRLAQIEAVRSGPLDILILGGGINGAGTLRDLALRAAHCSRPLRLGLIEQNHFASGTSGKNSQLIHGGLRYLKTLDFGLVRESLRERSTLLRLAPELVRPLPFLLPMYGWRSRILYGAGLSLYDLLSAPHSIQKHRMLSSLETGAIEPRLNRNHLTAAAVFYDCQVHSTRLVLANVIDAIDRGAIAVNYLRAERLDRTGNGNRRIMVRDTISEETFEVEARKIIDATGAWSTDAPLRLVRGSHIILPRVNASENAIAYFDSSGRVVFLIPWGSENQLTLAGTTDVDHSNGPDNVQITQAEIEYLVETVKRVFPGKAEIEVISSYSSLRPLVADQSSSPTSASRGHRIWNSADGTLHIAGGKYTTYRAMSEEAADLACREIAPDLAGIHLTADTALPKPDPYRENAFEQHLSDHLFVSTYLGYEQKWTSRSLRQYAERMAARKGWTRPRMEDEMNRVLNASYSLPQSVE